MTRLALIEYPSPPLVEAVFEVFLDQANSSSWTEHSFSRAKERFPAFSDHEQHLEQAGFTLRYEGGNFSSPQYFDSPGRIRRWTASKDRAVQFSAHMCAYNILANAYGHFRDHLDLIGDLFAFFLEESKPRQIPWIGQRYINHIKIPSAERDVASYFSVYPRLPAGIDGHVPFSLHLQVAAFDGGVVDIKLGPQGVVDETTVLYLLDIYAHSRVQPAQPMEADVGSLIDWQIRAHEQISSCFERCVSQRSRTELFC